MLSFRLGVWWLLAGSLFWIKCNCDANSEELTFLSKAMEALNVKEKQVENTGGNSESGLFMFAPDEIQTGDGVNMKPTYGRLRRDLWPDVKNRVNALMREMAEGAKMLKAAFNSALTGDHQDEKKKIFVTIPPPRSPRVHARPKPPVHMKRPLPPKPHTTNESISIASKGKLQNTKNNIKPARKPTTFKFFDDSLLEEIEKREEEKVEASLFNKKPNDDGNNGWLPIEGDSEIGKQPLKSHVVSKLNTNVMDQPLGKKIIYEKQIIPLKLTTENYASASSNIKSVHGFEPIYKQAETVNKPISVSFNKDYSSQNQNQNYNQRPDNHQLEVPNYSIDTYYNVPDKESTFKSPPAVPPKVQQYDIPEDNNGNYFTQKPKTRHQQRLKKNTESYPTTPKPEPEPERPNYPDFFFESNNNESKLRDQSTTLSYKSQHPKESDKRYRQRPNDRRHIQSLTTTSTTSTTTASSIHSTYDNIGKLTVDDIATRLNRLKTVKKTQSNFNATTSTKQYQNTTNKPPKRGSIKYGDKYN